jgi:hypothetical protein
LTGAGNIAWRGLALATHNINILRIQEREWDRQTGHRAHGREMGKTKLKHKKCEEIVWKI